MVSVIGVGMVEESVECLAFVVVVTTESMDLVLLVCVELSTLFVECVEIVGGVEGEIRAE